MPSDAIAVAVTCDPQLPIYVSEEVLNDVLRELGGHIGYDVRRSRRREGHARAMLAAHCDPAFPRANTVTGPSSLPPTATASWWS